jgi:hypothetical protein
MCRQRCVMVVASSHCCHCQYGTVTSAGLKLVGWLQSETCWLAWCSFKGKVTHVTFKL